VAVASVLAAGRVDLLINNAATAEPLGPTIGIQAGDLRLAYEVNVIAPAALTAAVLSGMLAAGWGRVVDISAPFIWVHFSARGVYSWASRYTSQLGGSAPRWPQECVAGVQKCSRSRSASSATVPASPSRRGRCPRAASGCR
jgi:NAD(P)-dependent dehydrogenase (short-subunit alcohol dehydrogenase family)